MFVPRVKIFNCYLDPAHYLPSILPYRESSDEEDDTETQTQTQRNNTRSQTKTQTQSSRTRTKTQTQTQTQAKKQTRRRRTEMEREDIEEYEDDPFDEESQLPSLHKANSNMRMYNNIFFCLSIKQCFKNKINKGDIKKTTN